MGVAMPRCPECESTFETPGQRQAHQMFVHQDETRPLGALKLVDTGDGFKITWVPPTDRSA